MISSSSPSIFSYACKCVHLPPPPPKKNNNLFGKSVNCLHYGNRVTTNHNHANIPLLLSHNLDGIVQDHIHKGIVTWNKKKMERIRMENQNSINKLVNDDYMIVFCLPRRIPVTFRLPFNCKNSFLSMYLLDERMNANE